jgi:hypothetical protein
LTWKLSRNFQVKLFPPKQICFYIFLNILLNIYANVFNIFKFELNPLVNKKKNDIGLNVLFRTFHDNFQVKLFPPKIIFLWFFFKYSLNIYANVFNIFKFELNPLDNKNDIGLYVLFRTFQVNFQDISVTPNPWLLRTYARLTFNSQRNIKIWKKYLYRNYIRHWLGILSRKNVFRFKFVLSAKQTKTN